MAKLEPIKINSILYGHSPSPYLTPSGGFNSSIAIDPDFALDDSGNNSLKASGVLRPVAYESFDGAEVNTNSIAIITNPKDAKVYVVLSNGKLLSYSSSLGSETSIGTVTGSAANGAVYYNNYIYIFTGTDVSRYGPLNNSPTLTNTVWTGATLGTQTALTNTTYPSIRGSGTFPNHWAWVHPNNILYFCDFKNGQGLIHAIKTSKTTDEGDTNNGSQYNALDLPFGYMPMSLSNFGNDLAILAIQTSNTSLDQGKAALFLWDTFSDTFFEQVPLSDGIATALINANGSLYFFAGKISATGGHTLYKYLGGKQYDSVVVVPEGHPPMQGAVDSIGNRIVWGSFVTYPNNSACVWAYGSKDGELPMGLQNIATSKASASSTDGLITCLKQVEQNNIALTKLVLGWRDASNFGLDKLSTTYQTHYWRSQLFNLNQPFKITRIKLSFGKAIATNMTLVPTLYFDDLSRSVALTTINNTNFANSERRVVLDVSTVGNVQGINNFLLELKWSGTAHLPVLLPITIEWDVQSP